MSALNASVNLLRGAVRCQIIPRSSISTKPAKNHISAGEQCIALISMFVAILGPSGWILSHIEDYKKH
ncbi:cytochrome c oxidase subunit 8B, mitochondrial [Hypomesus transpacificus]|uniref:cytochrome c oxidase subunit 8B, mitochondrial n=1 Tax=Hypomesus transpacificus TaxID=137520 RepID=UPI001F07B05A|nr:cytochrome c oxidase subunit 8B, mitochondrial [Hypomesus transpacificus]